MTDFGFENKAHLLFRMMSLLHCSYMHYMAAVSLEKSDEPSFIQENQVAENVIFAPFQDHGVSLIRRMSHSRENF